MVWNDAMLIEYAQVHGLVTPFDAKLINPCSIDLRLGDTMRIPERGWSSRESGVWKMFENNADDLTIDNELPRWGEPFEFAHYWLMPGEFVLCHSLEYVRIPVNAAALLFSKSSTGRKGLEHLHAGLGDAGFEGQWVFEFCNNAPWPILLIAGNRYMQMQLYDLVEEPLRHYGDTGRYQGQTGPTMAREAK